MKQKQKMTNKGVITTDASRVAVRVIHTDEEWMIANTVCHALGLTIKKDHDYENTPETCNVFRH
jgi:prophage antirepressor-like protein